MTIATLFATSVAVRAEPIDDVFQLCFGQTDFTLMQKALASSQWKSPKSKAQFSIAQQLAISRVAKQAVGRPYEAWVQSIPTIAQNLSLQIEKPQRADEFQSALYVTSKGKDTDALFITMIQSSVFTTVQCIFAGQSANNPATTEQVKELGERVGFASNDGFDYLPLDPQIPNAASKSIWLTYLHPKTRQGSLKDFVKADIALESTISYPRKSQ